MKTSRKKSKSYLKKTPGEALGDALGDALREVPKELQGSY
jgi:hypothetical protein